MTQHNTRSKEKTILQDNDCETNIKGKSAIISQYFVHVQCLMH